MRLRRDQHARRAAHRPARSEDLPKEGAKPPARRAAIGDRHYRCVLPFPVAQPRLPNAGAANGPTAPADERAPAATTHGARGTRTAPGSALAAHARRAVPEVLPVG